MVKTLMRSEKMATSGLLKIKTLSNKGYHAMFFVHDATQKIYHVIQIILQMQWYDQSLVTLVCLLEKL